MQPMIGDAQHGPCARREQREDPGHQVHAGRTIVAAWIRALTGVGPSMASGSHTCSGNWALLPTAPQKSSRPIQVTRLAGGDVRDCSAALEHAA